MKKMPGAPRLKIRKKNLKGDYAAYYPDRGTIEINPELLQNAFLFSMVLSHELGHLLFTDEDLATDIGYDILHSKLQEFYN